MDVLAAIKHYYKNALAEVFRGSHDTSFLLKVKTRRFAHCSNPMKYFRCVRRYNDTHA